MFDSLDDKIKHDNEVEIPRKERYIRGALIAFLSIVLFGGLYYAVRMID
jgi:hypothetical protein